MAAHATRRTYAGVFVTLLVLTYVTAQVAYFDFGRLNIVIALTIACAKALLVIAYFMHVRYASGLIRLFVVTGFFWLGILFVFTFGDYLTRPFVEGW